jgi:hypothetical protein
MNEPFSCAPLHATIGYADRDERPESTPVGNWGYPFALTADYPRRSIGVHLGATAKVRRIELWCAGVTSIGKKTSYRLYASSNNESYEPLESFGFRSRVVEGRTVDSFELPDTSAVYFKIHFVSEAANGLFPIRLLQLDVRAFEADQHVGAALKTLAGFRTGDAAPETGSLGDWGSTATFLLDVGRNSVGVDLGVSTEVARLDLYNRHSSSKGDGKGSSYKVYRSEDNVTYTEIKEVSFSQSIANFQLVHSFAFTGLRTRYLKVNTLYDDERPHFELYDNPQFRVKAYGPRSKSEQVEGSTAESVGGRPLPAPFDIGTQSELFLSRDLVQSADNVAYTLHQGVKQSKEPLITMDRPWEGYRLVMWGDVLYDEQERLFKMWYFSDTGGDTTYFTNRHPLLYATSADGIKWEKPLTGTIANNGQPTNAVAIPGAVETASVTKDMSAPPGERYKMVTFTWEKRYQTMVSPDGIFWTHAGTFGAGHDVASAVWDPYRRRYVAMHKCSMTDPGYFHPVRRLFYTSTSRDFKSWTPSYRALNADATDQLVDVVAGKLAEIEPLLEAPINRSLMRADLYGAGLYPHESGMIAFPWMFYVNDEEAYYYTIDDGIDDVLLAFSRDGVSWSRDFREPVIRRGDVRRAGPGATEQENAAASDWDCGWIYTASKALDVGDEVWLYYNGSNYTHTQPAHYYPTYPEGHRRAGQSTGRYDHLTGSGAFKGEIGLVVWKRDRFVSVDAGADEGRLVTKPILFGGGRLFVNADIGPGGLLNAELLDANGSVIPGFGADQCLPLQGDSLTHRIEWSGGKTVASLAGTAVKIRFNLKHARLYAYRFGQ